MDAVQYFTKHGHIKYAKLLNFVHKNSIEDCHLTLNNDM